MKQQHAWISHRISGVISTGVFILLLCGTAAAQDVVRLASVIATGTYIVGGPNMQSGLFVRWSDTDTTWTHLGPDKLRSSGHAIHPDHPDVIYIAAGNGVHKSTDRGHTWKIMTGWRVTEVLSIVIDPVDPRVLYIATAYGIHCSHDAGETWSLCSEGIEAPPFTSSLVIDNADHLRLYCAAETGAYVSSDGGGRWTRMNLSVQGIRCLVQSPANPNLLMAGTEDHGIYVTRDGGASWNKCESGFFANTFYTIAMHPVNPNIVYAGGYASGVYKSTDGGDTWKHLAAAITTDHVHSLAIHPVHPGTVYAALLSGGIFRSDDAGATWYREGLENGQIWKVSLLEILRSK